MSEGANAIKSVEVFSAGEHRGKDYGPNDLDEIVRNFHRYSSPRAPKVFLHVPAVIGHEEDQQYLERTDIPAAGWVVDLWRKGSSLFADFDDVPQVVADLIRGRTYRMVSAEIYDEPPEGLPPECVGKMLRRVAFLGADIPQVKGLSEIPTPVPSYSESSHRLRPLAPGHPARLAYRDRVQMPGGCWAAFSELRRPKQRDPEVPEVIDDVSRFAEVRKMAVGRTPKPLEDTVGKAPVTRRPRGFAGVPGDRVHVDLPNRNDIRQAHASTRTGQGELLTDVNHPQEESADWVPSRDLKDDTGAAYGDPEEYAEGGDEDMADDEREDAGGTPAPDHDEMRAKMLEALEEMGIDTTAAENSDDRFLAEIVRYCDAAKQKEQQEEEQQEQPPEEQMGGPGMPPGMTPGQQHQPGEEEHFAEDDEEEEDEPEDTRTPSDRINDQMEGHMEKGADRKSMRRRHQGEEGYGERCYAEDEEEEERGEWQGPPSQLQRYRRDVESMEKSAGNKRYLRGDGMLDGLTDTGDLHDREDYAEGDEESQADMDRDDPFDGKKHRKPKKGDEGEDAWGDDGDPYEEDDREERRHEDTDGYAEGDENAQDNAARRRLSGQGRRRPTGRGGMSGLTPDQEKGKAPGVVQGANPRPVQEFGPSQDGVRPPRRGDPTALFDEDDREGRRRWREWDYAEGDEDAIEIPEEDMIDDSPARVVSPEDEANEAINRRHTADQRRGAAQRREPNSKQRHGRGLRDYDEDAEDMAEDEECYSRTKKRKDSLADQLKTGGVMKMSEILDMVRREAREMVRRESRGAAGQLRKYSEQISRAEKKRGVDAAVERLSREGKLLPVEEADIRDQLMRADCTTPVRKFSEKGKTVMLTEFEAQIRTLDRRPTLFRELLRQPTAAQSGSDELDKVVKFSETAKFSSALKSSGSTPEEYVKGFEELRKKKPGIKATEYGVPEVFAG